MSHRNVELIGSTIRNGRIYFSTADVKFFPSDAYADREGDGHAGVPVFFLCDGLKIKTDIRIISATRLSPRCSFTQVLKRVGAIEGAFFRVTRATEREYNVKYLG